MRFRDVLGMNNFERQIEEDTNERIEEACAIEREISNDLLKALKAMTAWIGGMSFTPPSLVAECDALIAQAQAAIAKAESTVSEHTEIRNES